MLSVAYGNPPGPNSTTNFEQYSKASAAVVNLCYTTFWAIKIYLMIFFKRLDKMGGGRSLCGGLFLFCFRMATYFAF